MTVVTRIIRQASTRAIPARIRRERRPAGVPIPTVVGVVVRVHGPLHPCPSGGTEG